MDVECVAVNTGRFALIGCASVEHGIHVNWNGIHVHFMRSKMTGTV